MEKTTRVPGTLRNTIKEKIGEVFNEFYADGHNSANIGPGSEVLIKAILEAVMSASMNSPIVLAKSSGKVANTNSSNG